jgi:hypothetical protein
MEIGIIGERFHDEQAIHFPADSDEMPLTNHPHRDFASTQGDSQKLCGPGLCIEEFKMLNYRMSRLGGDS